MLEVDLGPRTCWKWPDSRIGTVGCGKIEVDEGNGKATSLGKSRGLEEPDLMAAQSGGYE